jgi:two-component system phosphate regulon response regulator PhoB
VLLNGKELTLTPKEYLLLEFLMQHPRQVLSRNQLLSRIWGGDFCGEPKTVDVHIRWLRQKIEEDPAHPVYITTVRGFGYRLG